jgi:salicylate hydroxylase
MLRAKLQNALLKGVDQSRIRVSSRLVDIKEQPNGRLTLSFEDGLVDEVDLLVGADGIRSVRVPAYRIRDNETD